MNIESIMHYMLSVRKYYQDGGTRPLGYNEDDKDMGYRSALVFYGISRDANTDLVANQIIYKKGES